MAEINVVPYIDVTLVLLVIFMVTAPMLQSGVDVDLPKAEARKIDPSEQTPVIVTINKDGLVYVDLDNQGDLEVAENDLAAMINAVLAERPVVPVLIRGDRKVEYGRVVELMARLKKAGVPSVGLMTNAAEQ